MDAFKTVVLVALLVTIAAFGFVAYTIGDAIQGAKTPDDEYGTVTSKGPVLDGHPASYVIELSNSKTLYIINNSTLYDKIQVNMSYLFHCRIDVTNHMLIVDSALLNRTICI